MQFIHVLHSVIWFVSHISNLLVLRIWLLVGQIFRKWIGNVCERDRLANRIGRRNVCDFLIYMRILKCEHENAFCQQRLTLAIEMRHSTFNISIPSGAFQFASSSLAQSTFCEWVASVWIKYICDSHAHRPTPMHNLFNLWQPRLPIFYSRWRAHAAVNHIGNAPRVHEPTGQYSILLCATKMCPECTNKR